MAYITWTFDDRLPYRARILPRGKVNLLGAVGLGFGAAIAAVKVASIGTAWMTITYLAAAPTSPVSILGSRQMPLFHKTIEMAVVPPGSRPPAFKPRPSEILLAPGVLPVPRSPADQLPSSMTPGLFDAATTTPTGVAPPAEPPPQQVQVPLPPLPPADPAVRSVVNEAAKPPVYIPLPPVLAQRDSLRRRPADEKPQPPGVQLAALPPTTTPVVKAPPTYTPPAAVSPAPGNGMAIYDIAAHTVYLPNGERLEAHSGLGELLDDPRSISERNRGVTPPNIYRLSLRESLFHGVAALRLTPIGDSNMFGRTGLLAHTFMLGPRGDSNGCVSFRDYQRFLQAFQRGEVSRIMVVTHYAGSVPASSHSFSLFDLFTDRHADISR